MKTVSTIQRFFPKEVIYPESQQGSAMINKIRKVFKHANFRPVRRNLFDETKGYKLYARKSNKEEINPNTKFVAYAALNALLLDLEAGLGVNFKEASLLIQWHHLEDTLIVETQTLADLEIFLNTQTKKKEKCFVEKFKCETRGGTRMLRANILQPLYDKAKIEERQNFVELLLNNTSLYQSIKSQLTKFKEFETLAVKFIHTPRVYNLKTVRFYITHILSLSNFILSIQNLLLKLSEF